MRKPDAKQKLAALEAAFNALAHPARRQIVMVIHFRGGEMSAGDIAGRFHHAWPTTTRHLGVLVAAGLLAQERRGRTRIYKLQRDPLELLKEWLTWFDKKVETPAAAPKTRKRTVGKRGFHDP